MLFPLYNLTFVINRAMLPIYSQKQTDRALVGRYYLQTLSSISIITAPLMLGLWAVRDSFVAVALGQKWMAATAVIAWLAPVGLLQSVVSTTGVILMATGRTKLMRDLGVICSAIYVLSFIIGLNAGAAGVARAYFFASLITSIIFLHYTLLQIDLKLLDAARSVIRPLICALVMTAAVYTADRFVAPSDTAALVRLLCLIPLGAGIYIGLLLVLMPDVFSQMKRLITDRSQ
jgi:PST family polysaccharide transporter